MNGRQFIVVLVITFIVGMVWLISDILFNTKASIPVSEKLQTLLEPVNPNFNSRVLETIEEQVPVIDFFSFETQTDFSIQPPSESTPSSQLPGEI